ncbi:3-oxoadipate enol-lactonase 2 [bacterium HR40]|nr:3-oxoadipate enol-lactonase 2 [bacterium HR40]
MPQIAVNGVSLHYIFDGPEKAPVLMFANSLGTDLDLWDGQTPEFGALFRILRYDMRGHGKSSEAPGECRIDDLGRDALGLLDALGIDRVHFCGLSLGGMVGQWLAQNHGQRLSSLVLCATACRIGTPELWDERIALVRSRGMTAIVDSVLQRWFTENFRRREPRTVEQVARMLLDTSPAGYAACCAAVRDADLCAGLERIALPTLCIAGRYDPATPPEVMEALAGRIANARLVVLEAAHLVNIEARTAFNDALGRFFAEIGAI